MAISGLALAVKRWWNEPGLEHQIWWRELVSERRAWENDEPSGFMRWVDEAMNQIMLDDTLRSSVCKGSHRDAEKVLLIVAAGLRGQERGLV